MFVVDTDHDDRKVWAPREYQGDSCSAGSELRLTPVLERLQLQTLGRAPPPLRLPNFHCAVGTAPSLAGSGRDWAAIGRQHGPRPSPEPVHVTLGPALLTSAREMTHAATISSSSSGWWWWAHSATLCHSPHPMTSPPPPWGSAPPPASPAVLTIAQVCRCRCEPSPASPPSMCPVPLMLPSPPSHNFTICNWL